MFNNRGQSLEYVKKSVEDNKHFEEIFKNHISNKYYIEIKPHQNPYKHYDFSYQKIHKIEYKGLYYSLNTDNNTAKKIDKNIIIREVIIGKNKIDYYKTRQRKNPLLRFYLIYAFYEKEDNEINKIIYRYIDITDLDKIFSKSDTFIHMRAEHYKINIKDLSILPPDSPFS